MLTRLREKVRGLRTYIGAGAIGVVGALGVLGQFDLTPLVQLFVKDDAALPQAATSQQLRPRPFTRAWIRGNDMGWIASLFFKMFTGSTLNFVSNIIGKLSDSHVAIIQAQTGLDATAITGLVNAEIGRQQALAGVMQAEMQHRIWWWGWALFVLPAGAYVAIIHIKSLVCPFYAKACSWNIPEVPHQIEAWDNYIVLSFFGLAAASSIMGVIAGRLGKL